MAAENIIKTLDELEVETRRMVGKVLARSQLREPETAVRQATLENIRLFTDAIGDYNPLWRDEAYAAKSRFRGITAHPMWVKKMAHGHDAGEEAGMLERLSSEYLPGTYLGCDMEFFRPIRAGDTIRVEERVEAAHRKMSKNLGPMLLIDGKAFYYNQRNELVTTHIYHAARWQSIGRTIERKQGTKAPTVQTFRVETPDPLVWARKRRGAQTLHWEDVKEGEELPTLKKGLYTLKEYYLFYLGGGGFGLSRAKSESGEDYFHGTNVWTANGGYDGSIYEKYKNMPPMKAAGHQPESWLVQVVTDWMGDDGTLKKFDSQCRVPIVMGDTNTVFGKVARKYVEGDQHLVDVGMANKNQAEVVTALGWATVALPSRG